MSDNRLLAFYQQALGGVSAVEELALRDEFLRRLIAAGITIDVNGIFTGLPSPPTIGGLPLSTLVAGDILYASGVGTLARLAAGATGTVLKGGPFPSPSWASIVNADISASAAIAYAKLNLALGIVNGDISASAAIAYAKLNLALSIVNADINASAAIAYAKLNLTGLIVNADISASAAIAASKLNLSGVVQAVLTSRGNAGMAGGSTNYFGCSYDSTTETDVKFPVPVGGTIKNLYVIADGAITGANTATFTVRKNAADQAVTCVVTGGATTANDTTHAFTVVAGDLLSVKIVLSASAETRKWNLGYALVTT